MKPYTHVKKRLLQDPAIRKEYDALGLEFALVETIIKKRLARGMSQADLARKIGTKQSAIARLESGHYNPSLKFLTKVAKALGARLKISLV